MRRAAVGLRRGTRGAASARPRVAVREARGLPRGQVGSSGCARSASTPKPYRQCYSGDHQSTSELS